MEEKLIEAVRVRKILYDTSDENYLKTKLKTEIWEEVAKEAGVQNGAQARAIWEKLRHSLRDALRRQQKSMKSGAPAQYIKQWKFQNQMGFLQPYMANISRQGNLNEEFDDSETQSSNFDVDVVLGECEEPLAVQQGISTIQDEAESQALLETATQASKFAKKLKKDNILGLLKRSMDQHEERRKLRSEERIMMLEQTRVPRDSLYHFFMCMYEATKNMPLQSQFVVRNDIFRVVTDMEATLLNISMGSPHQRPSRLELSPHSNQTASHSNTSVPTPDHSSHFKSK